jgi:serine/threonine protein kinase
MALPGAADACQFCGNKLALGAVACFRCGKMVEREAPGTTGSGQLPTQLGTKAKGELLENQWRLIRQLGQGAAGVVWQGADVGLDRPVAVKLLHEHLLSDPVAVARFERESRVLATLEHPHIVPILGVGKAGNRPFLVMKLLEGRSLAEQLHVRGGRLPVNEAVPLLSQLCEALDFIHGLDVLHRDLKPSNVFVGTGGQLWLLDLGLAHEPGSDLTRSGDVLGQVQYLSPEQLLGKPLGRRADVFSLGCLAFEVFAGHPPFVGEPRDVLAHQLHSLPPDISSLVPELPKELGALLRKALAKIPLERQNTAGEFAAELQRITGIAGDGTSTRAGAAVPLVMPRRRSQGELPRVSAEAPTHDANSAPTPQMREAATVPTHALAPGADGDSTVPVGRPLSDLDSALAPLADADATRIGPKAVREAQTAPSDPFAPLVPREDTQRADREGPTGPTRAQVRRQLRAAALVLIPLAVVVLAFVGLSLRAEAPLPEPPAPLPRAVAPVTPVQTNPEVADVDPNLTLPPEPKLPTIVNVDPGKETVDSSRSMRGGRVARPKDSRGAAMVSVRVFSPLGQGENELKADIFLDGAKIGRSPMLFPADPGPHIVQAVDEKFPMMDAEINAIPGETCKVEMIMLAAPPPAKPSPPESRRVTTGSRAR